MNQNKKISVKEKDILVSNQSFLPLQHHQLPTTPPTELPSKFIHQWNSSTDDAKIPAQDHDSISESNSQSSPTPTTIPYLQ